MAFDLDKFTGKSYKDEGVTVPLTFLGEPVYDEGLGRNLEIKILPIDNKEMKKLVLEQNKEKEKMYARGKKYSDELAKKHLAQMLKAIVVGGDKIKTGKKEIDFANLTLESAMVLVEKYEKEIVEDILNKASEQDRFYEKLSGN